MQELQELEYSDTQNNLGGYKPYPGRFFYGMQQAPTPLCQRERGDQHSVGARARNISGTGGGE